MRSLDPILGASGYTQDEGFGVELRHWDSTVSAVKRGLGVDARILIIGDSVMAGGAVSTNADRLGTLFRSGVQQAYRPGGEGFVVPYNQATPNRWTLGGAPTLTNFGLGVGQCSIIFDSADDTATITFTGDRFQIYYSKTSTSGNMKITTDGGTPKLVSCYNATTSSNNVWDSLTDGALSLTRGTHTVVCQADNTLSGHTVYLAGLDGIMIYDNDFSNGVQVFNVAHNGISSGDYYHPTQSNAINNWASNMSNIAPDLVIIELGLNDMGLTNTVTPSQFKTNIQGIIFNILNNGTQNIPLGYTPSIALVPLWGRADAYIYSGSTNGSTTFTASGGLISGFASQTGCIITGPGVPAGTRLTGFTNATTMTMSQAASANSGSYTITYQDDQWTPFRVAMYELARDNGYAVWDMYSRTGGYIGTDPDGISSDKLHPSVKGSQLIASKMTKLFTGLPDTFFTSRGDFNAAGQHFVGTADNSYTTVLPFEHWGDGSDGAWTPDGSTTQGWATRSGSVHTLTRDTNLTNLTVNSGITIITAGFRLMGNGTATIVSGGIIHHNGGNAGNGTSGAAGSAGAAATAGSTTASGIGGAGGAASLNSSGGNAGSVTNAIGGGGGNGGDGTSSGAVGSAGTVTAPVAARGNWRNTMALFNNMTIGPTPTAIAPGAGGGGGNGNTLGGGGGGGGGGGMLIVAFPVITNAGTITANGGNGGNGTSPGAGGGGGGGGANIIISALFTNTGTWTAAGGGIGSGNTTGSVPVAGSIGLTLWVKST